MTDKEFKLLRVQMQHSMGNIARFLFGSGNSDAPGTIAYWGKSLADVDFDVAAEVIKGLAENTRQMPKSWDGILGEICSEHRRRQDLAARETYRKQDRAKYSRETAAKDQTPFQERFEMSMLEKFKELTKQEATDAAIDAPVASDGEHLLRPQAEGGRVLEA